MMFGLSLARPIISGRKGIEDVPQSDENIKLIEV
jgi:hypothetical protein